jgi:hypothetical protein
MAKQKERHPLLLSIVDPRSSSFNVHPSTFWGEPPSEYVTRSPSDNTTTSISHQEHKPSSIVS